MRAILILAILAVGCGALDEDNPDVEDVLADMECEWVYDDIQACFCYSESTGALTWAPDSACWATGVPGNAEG